MTETDAVQPPLPRVDAAGATYVGRRPVNEDAVLLRPDLSLFLLADGAGGAGAGDVASRMALEAVARSYEATAVDRVDGPDVDAYGLYVDARRLASAVHHANREVFEAAEARRAAGAADASGGRDGMGTTLVALVPAPAYGIVHVAHVGDSRCYRLRGGLLEPLTEDHALLNDVLEMWPDLKDDALAKLPRNVVTRALGMQKTVRVTVRSFELLAGDRYLLCSDGLTETVELERLAWMLSESAPADVVVDHLIEVSRRLSANDNVAAVMLAFEPPDGQALPAPIPRPRARSPLAPGQGDAQSLPPRRESSEPEIVILGITEGPTAPRVVSRPSDRPAPPGWREAIDELSRK